MLAAVTIICHVCASWERGNLANTRGSYNLIFVFSRAFFCRDSWEKQCFSKSGSDLISLSQLLLIFIAFPWQCNSSTFSDLFAFNHCRCQCIARHTRWLCWYHWALQLWDKERQLRTIAVFLRYARLTVSWHMVPPSGHSPSDLAVARWHHKERTWSYHYQTAR